MRAVASALRTLPATSKVDLGAVALARKYAELIDEAAPRATYQRHLAELAGALALLAQHNPKAGADAHEHLIKVGNALSAHTVASDLGPKLLATLAALGLTPAGRGVRGALGGARAAAGVPDELRERRRTRARRAGSGEHPA